MKTTAVKMVLGSFAVCLALGALADDPVISDVTVRQRWPWSKLVDIDYLLTGDETQRVDIAVNAYDGTTVLTLPLGSFMGDLYGVSRGLHRIVWDPTVTAYTNSVVLTKFRVALATTPAPLYMIVDLTKAVGAEGQTAYVYESDLTNGLWGAWVRNPVTNSGTVVESVVWTGVTTNDVYRTTKLVLRRIRAGSFGMGASASLSTTLTKDFYAGVFEVTQRQWELIMGTKPSWFNNASYYTTRPVEQVPYDAIRGATNGTPTINWPATGSSVHPTNFLGRLRATTGIADFDLPTEAQWEYLCRARTTTVFNDGNTDAKITGSEENNNGNTNKYLNALGRYKFDGGETVQTGNPANSGTAVVGSYLPNAWGLYDTHGNVREWCLDWYGIQAGVSDPSGVSSGSQRVSRGGSWGRAASQSAAADRNAGATYTDTSVFTPSYSNGNQGFRLVRTLQ